MNLENLKRTSSSLFDKVRDDVQKIKSKKFVDPDSDTFWQPTVDKNGNGFAIIRFLPPHEGEDKAIVNYFEHAFQGPTGKWYIERSLTSLGQPDPVSEYNSKLWKTGIDSNKKIASAQKRKARYVSNVLVVKDPGAPEKEGNVFRYKFGKKILDKIETAMNPEFEGDVALNPFDPWEGANFRLKIRNVEKQRNYEMSVFDEKSAIGDDARIEEVMNKTYSLAEYVAPSHPSWKTFDELKARFDFVLDKDVKQGTQASTETAEPVRTKTLEPEAAPEADETDDDLEFFRRAAESDE